MSLNNLFELSRRSFRALDAAMNVTGQNVANINTEGYSRRRIVLTAESPAIGSLHTTIRPQVSVGAGVSVAVYERIRDGLLDKASWEAQGTLGFASEEHRIISTLEGLFPASGPGSLGTLLSDFWDQWSNVANNPTDNGVRLALRGAAETLATSLNRMEADIRALEGQTATDLANGVARTNDLLKEIASLNASIATARNAGTPDLEAEDRRDTLVKELGAFAPIRVAQDANAGYTISINGMTVVQQDKAVLLNLDATGALPALTFSGTGVAFPAGGTSSGKIGAWLHTLSETLPDTRAQLDQLARAIVTEVNALHTARYDDTGAPVTPDAPGFFHYSIDGLGNEIGVTAGSIRLSDEVKADASIIGTPGFYTASGDDIALAISALRGTGLTGLGGETVEHFAINIMSGIGAQVQRASAQAESQAAVVSHLESMAVGVSGVSLEEEMTKMIQFQQAFAASARVLNTVDEMMQTLLAI